ncbi:MAG: YfcE family phosphodiesterase [Sphaerochaetaceae bacterium]|nr:YfcE family phosphodiesterase [Sphaerochaetaceae bacterium]
MVKKIFVFSDLHGNVAQLKRVSHLVQEEGADQIIFAGDMGFTLLGNHIDMFYSLGDSITQVRGNVDPSWVFMNAGMTVPLMYTSITAFGRTIGITHGDYYDSWSQLSIPLTDSDIFICGHTHVPVLGKSRGEPYILNPGSVTSSRNGFPESYAIIEEHAITIKRVDLGTPIEPMYLEL